MQNQIRGEIRGQSLKIEQEIIASDTNDYLTAKFTFTEEWNGLSKWAHFKSADGTVSDLNLLNDEISRESHLNLSDGWYEVYLHGTSESGMRITTDVQEVKVQKTGILNGEPLPEIPLSAAEQIDAKAQSALDKAEDVENRANSGEFDGGYYTISASADGQDLTLRYTGSKPGMAEVQPQTVRFEIPGVSPEEIAKAVSDYLEQNPVKVPVESVNGKTGAVVLTAADVQAVGSSELPEAINQALEQAAASGAFKGEKGDPGKDGAPGADGRRGPAGKDGKDGKDAAPLKPLTFTGAVSVEYDGTQPVSVEIPSGGGGEQVQPDWNQNDETKPDYIKNRICYAEPPVESVWLPLTQIPPEGEVSDGTFDREIKADAIYKVRFSGVVYDCKPYLTTSLVTEENIYAVGDVELVKLPFYIESSGAGPGQFILYIIAEEGEMTVNEMYEKTVKLPVNLLPNEVFERVGRVNPDLVTAEMFNDNANIATGTFSHAEGTTTTSSGKFGSHAEGDSTTSSGESSHAEGRGTTASGDNSHAEGWGTTASGNNSHAEGGRDYSGEGMVVASGGNSHAEGQGTIASSNMQHVQGKYNIDDPAGKYAHIVGNGTGETDRSNAHTLDWEGNSWYQGSVLVGGTYTDAPDAELKPNSVIIKSSTPGSAKRFKITVTDDGAIKVTEI